MPFGAFVFPAVGSFKTNTFNNGLLTDNAKIVTFKRGSPPENYVELMNVRKYLKK